MEPLGSDTAGPTRFEVGVGVVIAALFGVLTFVGAGFCVFAVTLFTVPVLGPVLLTAGALVGVWWAVRGRRSARGFGVGLVVGWALLAAWTSGASLGAFLLR